MKIKQFRLYDNRDGGYFVFAPCIYSLSRKKLSIGLELLGRRFFYLDVRFK
tara:strand:- start:391 stop:543 length:153 start_codon:yes stop_codon:yes gene_type:complete